MGATAGSQLSGRTGRIWPARITASCRQSVFRDQLVHAPLRAPAECCALKPLQDLCLGYGMLAQILSHTAGCFGPNASRRST